MPTRIRTRRSKPESTEWQASYYSDYYAAYFGDEKNIAGGRHGDTVQLEAENAADTDEDKEWTRKMIDEGGAKK